MEIEVKRLVALNKFTGNFKFEYEPPKDICIVPLCEVCDVAVCGEFEIYDDDSVSVLLKLSYTLRGKCSYCLKDTQKRVEYSTDILFVTEKDDDNYFYDGYKINLKVAVDEALVISQPNVLLCDDESADGKIRKEEV